MGNKRGDSMLKIAYFLLALIIVAAILIGVMIWPF